MGANLKFWRVGFGKSCSRGCDSYIVFSQLLLQKCFHDYSEMVEDLVTDFVVALLGSLPHDCADCFDMAIDQNDGNLHRIGRMQDEAA